MLLMKTFTQKTIPHWKKSGKGMAKLEVEYNTVGKHLQIVLTETEYLENGGVVEKEAWINLKGRELNSLLAFIIGSMTANKTH